MAITDGPDGPLMYTRFFLVRTAPYIRSWGGPVFACEQTRARSGPIVAVLVNCCEKRRSAFIKQRSHMNSRSDTRRRPGPRAAAAATAVAAVLMLAACASTPPAPTSQLQAAQLAISNAERTDAGRYAAGELGEARAKLASANAAVLEERMVAAAQLADQSRVEAELALARTAAAKAAAVNEETKRSTKTLIDEMQRNTGDQS